MRKIEKITKESVQNKSLCIYTFPHGDWAWQDRARNWHLMRDGIELTKVSWRKGWTATLIMIGSGQIATEMRDNIELTTGLKATDIHVHERRKRKKNIIKKILLNIKKNIGGKR